MREQDMKRIERMVMAVVLIMLYAGSSHASTKEEIGQRGFLLCGISAGLPGFSTPDAKGNWSGLNVDICRAVAAAVLGDSAKVNFIPLNEKERFTSLVSGDVDILATNTTWTLTRDTAFGLTVVGTSYFDGQGFLVAQKTRVKSRPDLNGLSICVQPGTPVESRLMEYFRKNRMECKPIASDTFDQSIKNLQAGRCDAITGQQSMLLGLRLRLGDSPPDAMVLPELISKEPLGPVVRQGDEGWFNIVKWTLFAMIDAEELGITSKNVSELKKSKDSDIMRFLGREGAKGMSLGLREDWVYQIIRQVGNYGESFDRNLGKGSLLQAERGMNALWDKGGILYAPPIR
jgi:general L-amino acid transport system substrate-binding protein